MTNWSEPKVCFDGKRPAEIPEGAVIQICVEETWLILTGAQHYRFLESTPEKPLTYRYEIKPPETEPFAVVFYPSGSLCHVYGESSDGVHWIELARLDAGKANRIIQFFDKHRQLCEPEALEASDE